MRTQTKMILLLPLLAIAASPSLAFAQVLLNSTEVIKTADYPEGALRRREVGVTRFQVFIENTGRVIRCEILQSSNSSDLDDATCRLISQRAIFDVSNLPKGEPISYTSTVTWILPKLPDNKFILSCIGGGIVSEQESSYGSYFGPNGQVRSGVIYTPSERNYEETIQIEIDGTQSGRIRLPRSILPSIRGGNDGWFDLRNITISENEISAEAKVNFANYPKIMIDRVRGTVFIDARRGAYNGKCERQTDQSSRQF